MSHATFIIIAYTVFALFVAIDTLVPQLQRRQLLRELRGRMLRQRKKEQQ